MKILSCNPIFVIFVIIRSLSAGSPRASSEFVFCLLWGLVWLAVPQESRVYSLFHWEITLFWCPKTIDINGLWFMKFTSLIKFLKNISIYCYNTYRITKPFILGRCCEHDTTRKISKPIGKDDRDIWRGSKTFGYRRVSVDQWRYSFPNSQRLQSIHPRNPF